MLNLPSDSLNQRRFHCVFIALVANLSLACLASAQFSSGSTTTGTDSTSSSTGTSTGSSTMGSGSSFSLSASSSEGFSGVQRGSSIGSENVQGFGAAAESSGTTGRSSATSARGGGMGGLGGLGGLFGALGNAFGAQNSANSQPTIRVRLRSAINAPPLSSVQVQSAATKVFDRLPANSSVRNVNITMAGRTAVLTGVVSSEKDRRMSELLMRLEPGVSQIDNQITIAE
ncbi:BON domain-containing protein [Stieleria sp. JC731]|uniref:BON domain-containing protein n=1 Tax=Pirellulaceae TaxID=2691357 RepID=UPI001E5E0C67|nr:BON domain-containing protein [Stieleria sp. JC731]MCC9601626.1 BON domain-containing protein [Stieleria sp. JC731]